MNDFSIWFSIGLTHIASWQAYDHILFLFALCGIYTVHQWKSTLVLITAFTVGHSLTLALSTFNVLNISSALVEFLIPLTIVITCIFNIRFLDKSVKRNLNVNYIMALFFGCIHGLGFSTLLRSMLGKDESILFPLFSFNIGLEIGQIIVVFLIMLFSVALTSTIVKDQKQWSKYVSIILLIISFVLSIERFTELIKN
ncbi:MAG: HupE/UreJ family protein [Bacteroidetes bacterium]|nr:HupE/UreJ family protein [Bacteroidota bacterium]